MELFDLHADIGWHVLKLTKENETDILDRFHYDKLKKGHIKYVCMACFFDGTQNFEQMKEMIITLRNAILQSKNFDLVLNKEDLLKENEHIKAMISIEGLCGITEELNIKEVIRWFKSMGVHLLSLTWNEENEVATGVKGNKKHGLKPLGKAIIKECNNLNIAIDVSHANEKTFWDIMKENPEHVLATHSNVYELCAHKRNLTKEQIREIVKRKGIIGMNATSFFVDETYPDLKHFIRHMNIVKDIDENAVAFGFDYMDFFDEDFMIDECKNAADSYKIIEELNSWKNIEKEKIASINAKNFFLNLL